MLCDRKAQNRVIPAAFRLLNTFAENKNHLHVTSIAPLGTAHA